MDTGHSPITPLAQGAPLQRALNTGDVYPGLFTRSRFMRTNLVSRVFDLEGGGLMLVLIERAIYQSRVIEQWETTFDDCFVCRQEGPSVRLACAAGHDMLHGDPTGYRCLRCAQKEIWELKHQGIEIYADQDLLRMLTETSLRNVERLDRSASSKAVCAPV